MFFSPDFIVGGSTRMSHSAYMFVVLLNDGLQPLKLKVAENKFATIVHGI